MINQTNLKSMLLSLGFTNKQNENFYTRAYKNGASISVDFSNSKIIYSPLDESFKEGQFPSKSKPSKGFIFHRDTTLNFSSNENFVCLVCAHYLLEKGYEPKHIVFEPAFPSGGGDKPCYGDIFVFDKEYNPLVLIENKTYGTEFSKQWNLMQKDGGQLFSYLGNMSKILPMPSHIVLFTAEFEENKVLYKNNIITLEDNKEIVKEAEKDKSIKLFSNQRALLFDVWNETYGKVSETKGMLEPDIMPYTIGKEKYTINDLKELTHAEIRPIYHEFATILRNNAITDFEHSFYILIDLFLCKITDERMNPNDLQFYYKGVTRDTPKEYCGRLLKLYKQGKKELFKIDVVNKEEEDIKKIFKDKARSLTNGLYDGIKEFFEDIKYYNIKKFNFISVENKEEFEKNFQIIIKVAALIQDINLTNSETNHFFGDLFEGLLSKNVHQTEGQFFTPVPIVNFIINSLPDYSKTKKLKVLDYACGAGHFLTEFVKNYKDAKLFGIEKSQNLSQVAKIATILNGCEDANIVFKDALSYIDPKRTIDQDFEKGTFDLIIANPPYSVKGFLDTLDKRDRDEFELTNYVEEKAYINNNSIECFFIERAYHFLKDKGIFAIVLPSSILSNGNLYINTRDLLFKHFNILSLVSLNSRTFGSTGTNTIIMFAQKVEKNAEGLVQTFSNGGEFTQYTNSDAIFEYIKLQKYDKKAYFDLIQKNVLNKSLEENDVIKEYKENFKPTPVLKNSIKQWFENSKLYNKKLDDDKKLYKTKFNEFLKSNEFKKQVDNENNKQFIEYICNIEKDKLITFAELYTNNIAVLLSPVDKVGSKSNKIEVVRFLGYDWSNRKGDEGIKYITENYNHETDDSDIDIEAVNSINYIKTPLYNPHNSFDTKKYAYAIRKHICDNIDCFSFDEDCEKLIDEYNGNDHGLLKYENINNLIDYSRAVFDKAIKLNAAKKMKINYKEGVQVVKLYSIANIESGSRPEGGVGNISQGAYSLGGEHIDNVSGYLNLENPKYVPYKYFDENKKGHIEDNDILICKDGALTGKTALVRTELINKKAMVNEHLFIVRCNENKSQKYLFNFLVSNFGQRLLKDAMGSNSAQGGLNSTNLKNINIPLPSLKIQEQIIKECEEVDKDLEKFKKIVEDRKNDIVDIVDKITGEKKKLKDVAESYIGLTYSPDDINEDGILVLRSSNIQDSLLDLNDQVRVNCDVDDKYLVKNNDILICVRNGSKSLLGKSAYISNIKEPMAFGVFMSIIRSDISRFIYCYLKSHIFFNQVEELQETMSINQLTQDSLLNFYIPVPSLDKQKEIINSVDKLESEIINAKNNIKISKSKKRDIIMKLLIDNIE